MKTVIFMGRGVSRPWPIPMVSYEGIMNLEGGHVARQYCGASGKVANCQVAVTCVYADSAMYLPVNTRLYLPLQWTDAPEM